MTSTINNQPVYVSKLSLPVATGTSSTPSISPSVGSLCFDPAKPTSVLLGDGTNWNTVGSGEPISGATITNSTITFPTTGGTPATLDFYEVYQGVHIWNGIWAIARSGNVTYIRLGRMVVACFSDVNAPASGAGVIVSDPIPARFRPSQNGVTPNAYPIYGVSNGIGITPYVTYDGAGTRWAVYESAAKAYSASNWTGAGVSGINACTFVYWI